MDTEKQSLKKDATGEFDISFVLLTISEYSYNIEDLVAGLKEIWVRVNIILL
jgi:hypothetical protein